MPAEKSLETRDPACGNVEERLVIDLELTTLQRPTQILFKQATGLEANVHFLFKERERAAALRLGAVERHIRILQQLVNVQVISRRDRHPNAGANDKMVTFNLIGNCHTLNQALGEVAWRLPAGQCSFE